ARSQQQPMPVVGLLNPTWPDTTNTDRLRAFRQGLKDTGFVEGENITFEYRWAEGLTVACRRWLPTLSADRWLCSSAAEALVWRWWPSGQPTPFPLSSSSTTTR